MLKKYLLKGKQLINKKLQQYEIDTGTTIDYVNQQIPSKLKQPLAVLQKNIDLEESEKYEMYFKMYPNHHLSSFLLEKYCLLVKAGAETPQFILPKSPLIPKLKRNGKIENENGEMIKEKSSEQTKQQAFIPKYNLQLENKALILKQVVQQYTEGFYNSTQAILCMSVVHFHHKRGAQVQYTYPQTSTTQQVENLIVHHSMPDSSHNKNQDYNFFNFQMTIKGKKRMLFGVSYFKQIKVTEQHREKNKQLTRSYLQKAISIVSYLPLFGYLKMRLTSTVKVFFNDFNNFKIIQQAYKDLDKHLIDTWPQITINQLYIGSDLRTIINLFGVNEFYEIWKAVLYQKRVVVFAHSSSSASSFILSLLTLFPGLSTFGIYSKQASKYMQGLREYALPLKFFSSQNFMSMSFHIQDFNLLIPFQKNNKGSFLVGTTNRLLKQQNDYGVQMLVNLENCTIQKRKLPHTIWQPLSKKEKIFVEDLNAMMQHEKTVGYSSSEDKIRNHFHNFLKESLTKIITGIKQFKKFVKDCRNYECQTNSKGRKRKSSKGNNKEMGVQLNQQDQQTDYTEQGNINRHQQKDFPPTLPQQVQSMPFPNLLLSPSFQFFLQFHNQNLSQLIQGKIIPGLLIDNYKYFLKLQQQKFILYDWNEKKLNFGKGNTKNYEGKEIKFYKHYQQTIDSKKNLKIIDNDVRHVKSIFIGIIESGRYNKTGFYMDKTQIYEGDFYHGMKQGYGKLTNTIHKYIGNFQQDLYSGQGQLLTQKQIYVGQFREGLRNGSGKNQSHTNGLNYDGQWLNDRPEGRGVMVVDDEDDGKQVIGNFVGGRIDENGEVSFRYKDGRMYKGMIKQGKPEGKGFFVEKDGNLRSGIFENGILLRQQKEQGQVSDKEIPEKEVEKLNENQVNEGQKQESHQSIAQKEGKQQDKIIFQTQQTLEKQSKKETNIIEIVNGINISTQIRKE